MKKSGHVDQPPTGPTTGYRMRSTETKGKGVVALQNLPFPRQGTLTGSPSQGAGLPLPGCEQNGPISTQSKNVPFRPGI